MSPLPRVSLAVAVSQAALCQERLAQGLDPRVLAMGMSAFFDDVYLPTIQQSQRSWRSTRSRFDRHLRPVLGERPLGSITLAELQRFIDRLAAAGYAAATINRVIALLKVIFKRACQQGVLAVNPTLGLRLLPERNQRGRILREDEYRAFFEALGEAPPLVHALVGLLLVTGMRLSEALSARWEDVDWTRNLLRLPDTKNGRPRLVPLSPAALGLLEQLRPHQRNAWLFPGRGSGHLTRPSRAFRRVLAQAGVEGLWLHDLRRTFATLAAQRHPLPDVSRALGHSSVQVTERYIVTADARIAATVHGVGEVFGTFLSGSPSASACVESGVSAR